MLKTIPRFLLLSLFWMPVVFFSGLVVYNTFPYFSFHRDFTFLHEKGVLVDSPLWRFCFYVHIAASMVCLLSAFAQFSIRVLRKARRIHIILGQVYIYSILLFAAPAGIFMAFYAKGGIGGQLGFLVAGILWVFTTYQGLISIKSKNINAHIAWMMRSYALTLSALTFRIYHILFHFTEMEYMDNYVISLWLSVFGNLLVGELFLRKMIKNYSFTFKISN